MHFNKELLEKLTLKTVRVKKNKKSIRSVKKKQKEIKKKTKTNEETPILKLNDCFFNFRWRKHFSYLPHSFPCDPPV